MSQTLEQAVAAVKLKAKNYYGIELSEIWLAQILPEVMKTEPTIRSVVLYLAYKYNW